MAGALIIELSGELGRVLFEPDLPPLSCGLSLTLSCLGRQEWICMRLAHHEMEVAALRYGNATSVLQWTDDVVPKVPMAGLTMGACSC